MGTPGWTPSNLFSITASLLLFFGLTDFLNRAYHGARQQRAESYFLSGQALQQKGKYLDAVEKYRAAMSFTDADPRYRLALAEGLIGLRRWDEAKAHLEELRSGDFSAATVNLLLARIAVVSGDTDQAVADYQRAIYSYWAKSAGRIQARLELIDVLAAHGERKSVLAELLQLAAEAPEDPQVRMRAATLLLKYGSPEHALEIFRGLANSKENAAAAYVGMGQAQLMLGNFRSAYTAFARALHAQSDDAAAKAGLAQTAQILDLDPTLVDLNTKQRAERSRELVAKSLGALEACVGDTPPADVQELAGEAAHLLNGPAGRNGDTPTALDIAQRLWAARMKLCAAPAGDDPLAAVMAKITR